MTASTKTGTALPFLVAAAIFALGSAAGASELVVPQAHPEVAMDIPDGWTMERSATGFELRSPEKNSIVIGRTLGRDKTAVDTWRAEAGDKLKAFGVSFDTNAKASAKPTDVAKPQDKPDDRKPDKADKTSAFTTDPRVFTFSGTPSLRTPGTAGSNDPVKPGELSVESLTGFGATVPGGPGDANMPKLPFRAVQIYGATMNGKPVDVQLLLYTLPANRLFVMMQESGADDGRAVAMARSVRSAK